MKDGYHQPVNATDFTVECQNPQALDETLQKLGAAALVQSNSEYYKKDGYYVMRVFGDPGFVKFAVTQQGYAKIVQELPTLI